MKKPVLPSVELVVIGDELLAGRVVDTNSNFVCGQLAGLGLEPKRISTVGDDECKIRQAVEQAVARAGLVFVLGGMGPTPDDRTLEAVTGLAGRRLVLNKKVLRRIEKLFKSQGRRVPALARRQALVPQGAKVLDNPVGMVPGMVLEHQGAAVVLLPGVPIELKTVFTQGIRPFLEERFRFAKPNLIRVRTFGIPEAVIASKTRPLLKAHPDIQLAFYPAITGVDLVVRASGRRKPASFQKELLELLGDAVYEVGDREIEEVVGQLLRKKQLTLALAESCTGGLVGDRITNVPGSSDYYVGGVMAYSNDMKMHLLGVKKKTLERYGAVSSRTVREMVTGVCIQFDADVGIAVSGIAGPGGATPGKPVGLVYVGVALRDKVIAERHVFTGNRRMVKERAAMAALDLCRRILQGKEGAE